MTHAAGEPATLPERLALLDRLLEERHRPVPPPPHGDGRAGDDDTKRQLATILRLIASALKDPNTSKRRGGDT